MTAANEGICAIFKLFIIPTAQVINMKNGVHLLNRAGQVNVRHAH